MKRFLTYLFCLITAVIAFAESPRAFLKAEYESMAKTINTNTGDTITNNKIFVLRIGQGKSFYFDPQTNRIDSLGNDPQGKIMLEQAEDAAMQQAIANMNAGLGETWFDIREKMGISRGSRYKNIKDFNTQTITVWDSQMGDVYRYPVEMTDLQWELMDSTRMVLDYECQLATADYHGRKWLAWFTQEIPVQDGPWQLCGLPGLILKGKEDAGQYEFTAVGIESYDRKIEPVYQKNLYSRIDRKELLQTKRLIDENMGGFISARTGTKLPNNMSSLQINRDIDYLETDYR